jgi:hypothetical protein
MTAEEKFKRDVGETIELHIGELRRMVSTSEITEDDHDSIGLVLTKSIGYLIGLSPKGWEMFQKIINESREVHYNR